MVSGGGGSSSGFQSQGPASLSALFPLLAASTGLPFGINKQGSLAFNDPRKGGLRLTNIGGFADPTQDFVPGGFAPPIFSGQTLADIGQLQNTGLGPTLGTQFARNVAPALAIQGVGEALRSAHETQIPFLTEAASGDIGTFFDPAAAAFESSFINEGLPQIREQLGLFNTDTNAEILRQRRQGFTDIANQANQLRFQTGLEAAPLLGLTTSNLANIPLAAAQDLEAQALAARQGQRAESPGGGAIELLAAIQGLESPFGTAGRGSQSASNFNFGLLTCHAAAEYYGWYSPSWYAAREWIWHAWTGLAAEAFRRFYGRYSKELAYLIRTNAQVREAMRPLFDWFRRMGEGVVNGAR
jgi:hypothetical protein